MNEKQLDRVYLVPQIMDVQQIELKIIINSADSLELFEEKYSVNHVHLQEKVFKNHTLCFSLLLS